MSAPDTTHTHNSVTLPKTVPTLSPHVSSKHPGGDPSGEGSYDPPSGGGGSGPFCSGSGPPGGSPSYPGCGGAGAGGGGGFPPPHGAGSSVGRGSRYYPDPKQNITISDSFGKLPKF